MREGGRREIDGGGFDGGNDVSLAGVMAGSRVAVCVTDPTAADNPITYVNTAFERLTLYPRDEAVGYNCRFLQGEATDPADVAAIRAGLDRGEDFVVTLTNHRADGSTFRNQLFVSPVHDDAGRITAYFGLLRHVDAEEAALRDRRAISRETMLKELQHRVTNHLAMVVSMIRLQSRREITAASLDDLSHRVEALSLFYDELFHAGEEAGGGVPEVVAAGPYLERVAAAVTGIEGRARVRLDIACDEVALPLDTTARLGLLLSEFLTNAFKHAFVGRDAGVVTIRLSRRDDGAVVLSVSDDGVGLPVGSDWPAGAVSISEQHARSETGDGARDAGGRDGDAGLGGSIVDGLARSIGAEVRVVSDAGTRFEVEIPAGGAGDDAG